MKVSNRCCPHFGRVSVGLLSELAPKAVLIEVLVNPENLGVMAEAGIAEIMSAARTVGRQAIILKAGTDVDPVHINRRNDRVPDILSPHAP